MSNNPAEKRKKLTIGNILAGLVSISVITLAVVTVTDRINKKIEKEVSQQLNDIKSAIKGVETNIKEIRKTEATIEARLKKIDVGFKEQESAFEKLGENLTLAIDHLARNMENSDLETLNKLLKNAYTPKKRVSVYFIEIGKNRVTPPKLSYFQKDEIERLTQTSSAQFFSPEELPENEEERFEKISTTLNEEAEWYPLVTPSAKQDLRRIIKEEITWDRSLLISPVETFEW